MNRFISTLAFVALAVVTALPAHAATISLPTVNGGVSAGTSVSGSANSTVTAEDLVSGSDNSHAVISNVSITPAKTLNVSGQAAAQALAHATSAPATTLSVSRAQVTASTTSAIHSSNYVRTPGELKAYVLGRLTSEKDLHSASFSSSQVKITYGEPGKLFGFIPVTMNATATADAKGNIQVSYPWYHFMVKARSADDVQTNVSSYTKLMLDHLASTTDGTAYTVRMQARLFDELRLALEGAGSVDSYGTTGQ